jgi:septal ring factor EnvC (AmiA/AmiB activator)
LRQSDTPASECPGLARACSAAAKELAAARDFIEGLKEQIAAADERITVAQKEIETLRRIGALSTERAKELEAVIAAEKDQVSLLLRRKEMLEQRITSLEKQLGRARKLALITGVAAAVGILIALGK